MFSVHRKKWPPTLVESITQYHFCQIIFKAGPVFFDKSSCLKFVLSVGMALKVLHGIEIFEQQREPPNYDVW